MTKQLKARCEGCGRWFVDDELEDMTVISGVTLCDRCSGPEDIDTTQYENGYAALRKRPRAFTDDRCEWSIVIEAGGKKVELELYDKNAALRFYNDLQSHTADITANMTPRACIICDKDADYIALEDGVHLCRQCIIEGGK